MMIDSADLRRLTTPIVWLVRISPGGWFAFRQVTTPIMWLVRISPSYDAHYVVGSHFARLRLPLSLSDCHYVFGSQSWPCGFVGSVGCTNESDKITRKQPVFK